MKFYGRAHELELLRKNEEQSMRHATFTVLMGRRRVGKTTLLRHAFAGMDKAYLFVSRDSEAILCQKFQKALSEQLGITAYGAISRFSDLFELVMKESLRRHFTLIIDEFQELQRCNPAIFSQMQDIWDRYHMSSKINLIVCGSIHPMMKRIFGDKSEPLFGRPTSRMTLRPFSTTVLKQILSDANPKFSNEDLLCFYMITGGVAKYAELLIDANSVSKDAMLDYVCSSDSFFISEGMSVLSNEFQGEFSTYFSIMQLIAGGMTRRSEIDSAMQKDTGAFLKFLDERYEMVGKLRPMLAKPGSKISAYEIRDEFLRFWFRFIYPFQSQIENDQLSLVRENIDKHYTEFTGRTLERYFQKKLMETRNFTEIGNWWDRKGKSEIDIVAINSLSLEGVIAEVKRNSERISITALKEKAKALPPHEFGKYHFKFKGLSLADM